MANIHKSTLKALRNHLLANRNATDAVIAERIGSDLPEDILAYREALAEEFPEDDYSPEDDEEGLGESAAPVPAPVATPSAADAVSKARKAIGLEPTTLTFLLRHPSGQTEELEKVAEKNGRVILQAKVISDIVSIIVKGNPVQVDLAKVRLLPPDALIPETGHTASMTLMLGELAK